jgi:hypothetical protein
MKKYYGNYLGICINNQDPEFRGRVQIFIPHIMPALYEGWNQEGIDITIECVGNNLPNGLNSGIIEKLTKMLPWAEGAMPIIGTSVGGQYNPSSGNFNQTSVQEGQGDINLEAFSSLNLNDNLTKFVASIGARETSFSASEASSDYYNAVSTVQGQSYRNSNVARGVQQEGLTLEQAQAKYGDYGFFQTNQNDVEDAVRRGVPREVASAMNNGGGRGNYTVAQQTNAIAEYIKKYKPQAAAAASRGDWPTANSLLNGKWPSLPGGRSHRPTNDAKANSFLNGGKTLDLNSPATGPTPTYPPTSPIWQFPDGGPYPQQTPGNSALMQANTPTPVTTGSPANLAQKAQAAAFKSPSFGAGSTSNCGKIARGVDYNILQDNYFNKSTGGNSRGSANVSIPYWVQSGYYQVEQTVPDKIPFGSKVVFAVGQGDAKKNRVGAATNGHVTTVGDNGALFGSIAGESFAKYNNLRGDQKVTILTPTQKYRDRYKQLYGTVLPEYASSSVTSGAGKVPIDDGGGDTFTTLIDYPSPTQITPTDTAGMPAGVFAVPGPGAMLWVFFREGDPMFPVYFAASYGRNEWQNAYQASSQPLDYGNVSVMRTGAADVTISNSNLETPFTRHASYGGSYNEFNLHGQTQYTNGNKESYVNGRMNIQTSGRQYCNLQDDTKIVFGNNKTIIGNASQECLDTVEQLTQKVKQVNEKMLEGGNNAPKQQTGSSQQVTSTSQLTPQQNTQRNELAQLAREEFAAADALAKRDAARRKKFGLG